MQAAIIERKPLWYSYWTAVLVLTAIGLGALGYRFALGLKVTNMGTIVPWGLWISLYIFFIGLSAGSFLVSSLIYVFNIERLERVGRLAVFSAIVALLMGMLFVFVDLGHYGRFWKVFTNLAWTSVMWYEIMLYILYVVILGAELYFLVRTDLINLREASSGARRTLYRILALGSQALDKASLARDRKVVKVLAVIGIPTAVGVHGGTGAIFAVVKAQPFWYSPLLPIVFLISALASGAALMLVAWAFFFRPQEGDMDFLNSLAKLALGVLAFDWILVIFELLVGFYGQIPEHTEAVAVMVSGPFWWVFWGLQFGVGALIPAYLILGRRTRESRMWLGIAGLLIVLGIVGVRLNIVIPALVIPQFSGLPEAFSSFRLQAFYFPSLTEWAVGIGLVAFGFLLFSLGKAFLPLQHALKEE